MQRPTIAGVILLCLFGLPFAGFGLFFAATSALAFNNGNRASWPGILFGVVFSSIGFGLMAAAVLGYKKANQQADQQDANPTQPWTWKPDWAAGRADGNNPKANIAVWVFAALWDAISFPVAALVLPKLLAQQDPRALLVIIFPLAGFAITLFAIRGTMRALRYGRTNFRFDSARFSPGSRVKGSIHLKLPSAVPHGFDLTLSCKRHIVTGSGKSRSVQELVLWQEARNISAESIVRGRDDAEVPVDFAIPADAYQTDEDNSDDRVYWQLHAQADVPGVDFSDDYELPVFKVAGADANQDSLSPTAADSSAAQREVSAPSSTRIVLTQEAGGPSFYFPPLRNGGQALGLLAFAAIWSGVVYFLWITARAPWLFRVVFSLGELLVLYALLNVLTGTSLLRVRDGMLEARNALLGLGTTHGIPLDQVISVMPTTQGQANMSGKVMCGIVIRQSDGREFNIAANSLRQDEADWVVATIDNAMGRKQDTRLQFRSFYGPPPQPAPLPAYPGPAVAAPAAVKSAPRNFAALIFLAWLVVAGVIFYRSYHRLGPPPNAAAAARSTARPAPVGPMTSADETRIAALPVQEQAEELLERSVLHDERALELFERNIDGWTGQLRFTTRMTRLEQRSRYSKDLRVRHANADLNLALQGWRRDQQSADALMQQAHGDARSRPSAYYYLGMEGGRGVDSDRIFAFLSDRALHDDDPLARQWAVEGLQFFQTDQALDVLYQSFTTDPAMAVRDRAGCNVSDCGIFTRAQRMRYVPKLIELSGDPSLAPQMRSWTFLALNEITDASVPANSAAWRAWYQQHGAAKTQEFSALPWYSVRGDE